MGMRLEKTRWPGVYKRGDQFVALVRYKETGRWRTKWISGSQSIRETQAARRRFLDQLDKGLRPVGGKSPLVEYLRDVWLPEVERVRRTATVKTYRNVAEAHIIPALGDVRLADIGRDEIRTLHARLAAHPALSRAGLDVRTVADRLGHASPELIFSTYSHWIASADREAAAKIGAVLTGS